jgi:hypothetical protein
MAETSILDFGDLSLEEALAQKAKQVNTLDIIGQYLGEAPAFTSSGRDIVNPSTSRAIMGSRVKSMPLPPEVEGKTVAEVYKATASLKNSNAILDAIIAAKTPIPVSPQVPVPPIPGTPTTPKVIPGVMSRLNPILNLISGLTYSSDLNSGEDQQLAARRKYNKETFQNGN